MVDYEDYTPYIAAQASYEAERGVLAALLNKNDCYDFIAADVRLHHFTNPENKAIYAEICKQATDGKGFDILTVHSGLNGSIDINYLTEVHQTYFDWTKVKRYAQTMIDRYKSDQLKIAGDSMHRLSGAMDMPINERLDIATGILSSLVDDDQKTEWISAYDGMVEHTQVLEDRFEGKVKAWSTGIRDLDRYLEGGLRPSEIIVIGARPSMGKTAMGMTIGVNMATDNSVGFMSMEMSHLEVRDRLNAMVGKVSLSAVKRPKESRLDFSRIVDGTENAKNLSLHVIDRGGLNINQVKAQARLLKRTKGLDVLIVDYIGLMSGLDSRQNRNTQLEEISRGLKTLAKELQIAVVVLAQLNRKNEERPEQMPQMSDLRDSGAIEQDADVIIFIKRPIMSNPEMGIEWENYAKLSVAKNRQGRCGYLDMEYVGEQTRFSDWVGNAPFKSVERFKKGVN